MGQLPLGYTTEAHQPQLSGPISFLYLQVAWLERGLERTSWTRQIEVLLVSKKPFNKNPDPLFPRGSLSTLTNASAPRLKFGNFS